MNIASAYDAVIARPRDDAPRSRFADLIAASEPETAAFILAQLDVASRRRRKPRPDRAVERSARSCGLPSPAHDQRGLARVAALLDGTVPAWAQGLKYGRGFVETATIDGRWFEQHGSDLMALAPIIDVTVHNPPADAEALFDSPAWAQVRSLRFSGTPVTMGTLRALVASPYLSKLTVLAIDQATLPEASLHLLAGASGLGGLAYVRADGNQFPDVNPSQDEQDGVVYGELPSAFAATLAAKVGPLRWLKGFPAELDWSAEMFE